MGKLSGFTLLFEALVLCLCREMPFAAVARLVGESWHRVAAIAERYVELALAEADYAEVRELAIDETSKAWRHDYVTIAAERRAVIFVTETQEAQAVARLAEDLATHGGDPEAIRAVSIDMSPAYIKGGRDAPVECGRDLRQVSRDRPCLTRAGPDTARRAKA